jgi:murein DD-endopeptidase MepM/ murein hydrolase activator NlpD
MKSHLVMAGRMKGFCRRLSIALLIFAVIFGVFSWGGASGEAVRKGVDYLLTKHYDFSGYKETARQVFRWAPDLSALGIKPRQDLDVEVTAPGKFPDLPVSGKLARGFGWQKDSSGWPCFYSDIELSAAKGAPVRAVLAGKVVRVEADKELGKFIVIEHEGDRATLYGRLAETGVQAGEDVAQGQVIGTVADTLLRFQLREGDRLVDPLSSLMEQG